VRIAIYARRSPDDDPSKSVERQISHAASYALKKGWQVLEEHIYTDDGISGGEFQQRVGLLRLLNALKPRPPFNAVVMSEASRLGRERLRTELVARDLCEAGVRIFYYLTDEEERLDTPEQRFVMAARGFAAEMEREKAKQRTRDALLSRANRGHVTGGGRLRLQECGGLCGSRC
jgi:site-specific DNA recombinase